MGENDDELPNTLTPSTPLISEGSQETILPGIWGRLVHRRVFLTTIELRENCYVFGRSPTCEINMDKSNFHSSVFKLISKQHFLISKDNTAVPYIQDLSKNGTYLNGTIIGKDQKFSLCDGDIIAVGAQVYEVYQYKDEMTSFISQEFDTKYKITRLIGCGAFGEVYLAIATKSCQRYAVKKIKITGRDQEKITNEIKIMNSLNHPCIVQLIEAIYARGFVYIILEYMEGGELQNRVMNKGKLNEKIAKLYMYQIVLAVRYLHECGITHRDLKPENVLLATKEWTTLLKLTDFGLSKIVGNSSLMRTLCGTPLYVAPEIINSDGCTTYYTPQVDIWSLGCIIYFTLFGRTPFQNERDTDENNICKLYGRIKRAEFIIPVNRSQSLDNSNCVECCQNNSTEDAEHLIKLMLTLDPNERITIQNVLKHNWFQDQTLLATMKKLLSTTTSDESG